MSKENLDKVRYVKLVAGEDFFTTVVEETPHYITIDLAKTVRLVQVPSENGEAKFAFIPGIMQMVGGCVEIDKLHILFVSGVPQQLENSYRQLFSDIQVVKTVPPDFKGLKLVD